MPRRSNAFQRLVYLIQQQVSPGATVTDSKFLHRSDTGALVEVDIVVDGSLGGTTITVGVECAAGGRPASVEWVNRNERQHQDLPIDKTIPCPNPVSPEQR